MRVKFCLRTPNRSEDMAKKPRMGPQSFATHLHVQDTAIAGVAQSCQRVCMYVCIHLSGPVHTSWAIPRSLSLQVVKVGDMAPRQDT